MNQTKRTARPKHQNLGERLTLCGIDITAVGLTSLDSAKEYRSLDKIDRLLRERALWALDRGDIALAKECMGLAQAIDDLEDMHVGKMAKGAAQTVRRGRIVANVGEQVVMIIPLMMRGELGGAA